MSNYTDPQGSNDKDSSGSAASRLAPGISPLVVGAGIIVLALLVDLSLGAIKYNGFWSTLSINVFDYMAFPDLLRSSGVPWLCSLAFGLFLRATIVLPERVMERPSLISKIFQNTRSQKVATIVLLAVPFVLYSIFIINLPNNGMLARSPFFILFLLCLYAVIRASGTPLNIPKAIAISFVTFTMMASTEATIARQKACDRVAGFDEGHLGDLRDYSFKYELQSDGSNSVAVYIRDTDQFVFRSENVVPKCAW